MSLYLRALLASTKKGLPAGGRIPRLERTLPAAVADERSLARFRELTAYPDDGYLPLTWPYAAAFRAHLANLVDPRFPWPLIGTVHVATRIVQRRAVGAGEALRYVVVVEGGRETEKGFAFDLETRAYAGPELVWEGAATMLHHRPEAKAAPLSIPERASLDGLGAVSQALTVPSSVGPAFAALSGDYNPIHISALAARAFGFKGRIAHGMWSLSRLAAARPPSGPWVLEGELKTPLVIPARAVYRDWPAAAGGFEQRLLDAQAQRPHVIARTGPLAV